MDVELATESDLPSILAISNAAAERTAANFATQPELAGEWVETFRATRASHPWLVVRDADRVVAFAKGSLHRARGAYRWTAEVSVYVDPEHQARGVGRALYRTLIPLMRAQGYVTLLGGITTPNPASERLHASFGFQACGIYPRAGWKFGRWHDVVYWHLHLQPEIVPPSDLVSVEEVWPKVRAGLTGEITMGRVFLDTPGVMDLVQSLNAELASMYPEPGANHFRLDEDDVKGEKGAFLVARLDGEAVGCGAIRRIEDDAAELKRMYVLPRWRGLGVSKALLVALEEQARKLGANRALLETGTRQLAAVALYEKSGYTRVAPWGEYIDSPLSLCMGRQL